MNLMSINGEKWVVVLSDGRVLDEETLCDEPRRISPWGKLMEICKRDDAFISILQLHVLGRAYQLPIKSHNPARSHNMEPHNYLCMRRSVLENGGNPVSSDGGWIGGQCEFKNGAKLIIWVNIYTGHSYTQIE